MTEQSVNIFDRLSQLTISLLVFLLPIFFIPSSIFSFQYDKAFILMLGALFALLLWLIGRIKSGSIYFSSHPVFISLLAIVIITFLSALASGHMAISLLGNGYEIDTACFVLIFAILTFLTANLFKTKEDIFYVYLTFIFSFLIVVIFQVLRLFIGPNFLSFNLFTGTTANLIGKWNDLAVFAGAAIILSLSMLEFFDLNNLIKWLNYIVIVCGFFIFAITNLYFDFNYFIVPIAGLIGFIGFIFFVYILSSDQIEHNHLESHRRKIPIASLLVVIFSIMFVLASAQINSTLDGKFGINQVDIRPSWQATYDITISTFHGGVKDVLLGVGPSRFVNQWSSFRPESANNSNFWNTDFIFGVGLIPSLFSTVGLLGVLAWIVFLIFYLILGLRVIFRTVDDKMLHFLVVSSFIVSLYFWFTNILYVPSIVTEAFGFIFTGLFFASCILVNYLQTKTYPIFQTKRGSFISTLIIIIAIIILIIWSYTWGIRALADAFTNEASIQAGNGNINQAELLTVKAINIDSSSGDIFRFFSQLALNKINTDLSSTSTTAKTDIQNDLSQALGAYPKAVSIDQSNYKNWLALGDVYSVASTFKIQNAYSNAVQSYDNAIALNPLNPSIYLTLANLNVSNGSNTEKQP